MDYRFDTPDTPLSMCNLPRMGDCEANYFILFCGVRTHTTKELEIIHQDMPTVEKEHNTGRCHGRMGPMPDYVRCCENYHHCGYKISRDELIDEYSGHCFTEIVWKCPECGCKNELRYKVTKHRRGVARQIPKIKPQARKGGSNKGKVFSKSMKRSIANQIRKGSKSDTPSWSPPESSFAKS